MPFYAYLTKEPTPEGARYLITAMSESAADKWYSMHRRTVSRITPEWYTFKQDSGFTEYTVKGVVVTRIADAVDTTGRSWVTFQNSPTHTSTGTAGVGADSAMSSLCISSSDGPGR